MLQIEKEMVKTPGMGESESKLGLESHSVEDSDSRIW